MEHIKYWRRTIISNFMWKRKRPDSWYLKTFFSKDLCLKLTKVINYWVFSLSLSWKYFFITAQRSEGRELQHGLLSHEERERLKSLGEKIIEIKTFTTKIWTQKHLFQPQTLYYVDYWVVLLFKLIFHTFTTDREFISNKNISPSLPRLEPGNSD